MKIEVENPEEVVKEAFWLAWQAAGREEGMGVFKAKSGATRDQVWENVVSSGDYAMSHNKPGDVYGDYVFGRMLKLGIKWDAKSVTVRDSEPRSDYQAWCRKYPSYWSLIEAAVASVGTKSLTA